MAACKTGTAEFGGADERGFRKTHGWFSVVVGVPQPVDTPAELEVDQLKTAWLEGVKQQPLPKKLVITVLVESDEVKPYKEGSADAAPVALEIVNWMKGSKL